MPHLRTRIGCLCFVSLSTCLLGCSTPPYEHVSALEDADTPYSDTSPFTDDWPQIGSFDMLAPSDPARAASEAANRETERRLETKVTLTKENLELDQAIRFIRDKTRANIAVNWATLELVGIDQDTLAVVHAEDITVRTLLEIVLEQANADVIDDDRAAFLIRDGVVRISTLRELRQHAVIRAYDISWFADVRLIMSEQLYKRHRRSGWLRGRMKDSGKRIHIDADDLADWSFFVPGGSSIYGSDGSETSITFQERAGQLMDLVQINVGDQDEWLDQDRWSMYELGDQLVIKTTPENHAEIKALFRAMRKAQLREFEQQARTLEVVALLRQAEEYRLKQDYREALEKINHALRVDPNSLEARTLKEIITGTLSR